MVMVMVVAVAVVVESVGGRGGAVVSVSWWCRWADHQRRHDDGKHHDHAGVVGQLAAPPVKDPVHARLRRLVAAAELERRRSQQGKKNSVARTTAALIRRKLKSLVK